MPTSIKHQPSLVLYPNDASYNRTTVANNLHIEAMAWRLQPCATGATKRVLITSRRASAQVDLRVGRFSGLPLGRDPSKRIICANYSENLAS